MCLELEVRVIGGGPAGSAAALAAVQYGAQVQLVEKSRFPRHKVCGEYFSPEIAPALDALGAWADFVAAVPARIRRLELHFARREKRCKLPETAYGLSRYRFDDVLFRKALAAGAHEGGAVEQHAHVVIAHGRKNASTRGGRTFGFKAHFEGPADDAIELYFFDGCYVGVNCVEDGITNVCGLGPEEMLRSHGFDIDALVNNSEKLRERLRPLNRKFKWLTVGPLVFENRFRSRAGAPEYLAGDALSFVDPFTGSGMLCAVATGRLAGMAAAQGIGPEEHLLRCARLLQRPSQFASLCRKALANGWGERLAEFIPGNLLISLSRPHRVL